MTRQLDEVTEGNAATIAGVISDLKEKGYTIKEVAGGTNSVIGVKLNKIEISMGKNTTEELIYEYEYASGTTVRYFVEVDGKDYEIIFNNGEVTVSTVETDLTNIDKLPEVTVTSSNSNVIEVSKTEEGKIVLTSKDVGGTVTITVKCGNQNQTCTVTVELFVGLDKSETNPEGALPSGDIEIIESDASKGIVIKDQNEREWVWVEVPKTIFTTADSLGEEKTEEQLNAAIKADLITYAGVYRNSPREWPGEWTDEWYSGCGVSDAATYNTMYNKMLNSVYNNGGFWIQRYEDGTVSITCGNAQIKASEYSPDSTKTSSLLFGIQWDLVCRYLDGKDGLTTAMINSDSSSWGNYSNNSLTAKSDATKKMNIYDFAGNYFEWTLEHVTTSRDYPCSLRGGRFLSATSYSGPASYRFSSTTFTPYANISFRATFY